MEIALLTGMFLCMVILFVIIIVLIQQLDELQNKLIARNFTEYKDQSREKPMKQGGNFIQDAMKKRRSETDEE